MANISRDIDKHDGTGLYGAGTPKKIIASDADNSITQLTKFEFSFVFTFSRRSPISSFQSTLPALIIPMPNYCTVS